MKATVRELESRLLGTSGDGDRLGVLLELARAHAADFRNREGLRAAREALAIARRRNDPLAIGQALSAATLCHYQRGDHVAAVATGIDAVEAYADGDVLGRSRAFQSIALALFAVEAFDLAGEMAARAVADANAGGDRERVAFSATVYGIILGDRGRFNDARRQFRTAAAYYRAVDDQVRLKKSASNLGHTWRKQGEAQLAKGLAAQARVYWKRALGVYRVALGAGRHEPDDAIILGAIAQCECRVGELEAAYADVTRALELARRGGNVAVLAHCYLWEGHILDAKGLAEAAQHAFERAAEAASTLEYDEVLVKCLRALAEVVAKRGNPQRAKEICERADAVAAERASFLARVREELSPIWDRYTGERPGSAKARTAA